MSEAPRDGSYILLPRGKGFVSVSWDSGENAWLFDLGDGVVEIVCENDEDGWFPMPNVKRENSNES